VNNKKPEITTNFGSNFLVFKYRTAEKIRIPNVPANPKAVKTGNNKPPLEIFS